MTVSPPAVNETAAPKHHTKPVFAAQLIPVALKELLNVRLLPERMRPLHFVLNLTVALAKAAVHTLTRSHSKAVGSLALSET